MIEITENQLERIHAILGGVPDGVRRAIWNVTDRALQTIRTETFSQISGTYAISKKNLRADTNISMSKTEEDGAIIGQIKYSSLAIPLHRFNVSPAKSATPGKSQHVSVGVLKGARTRLNNAFVAQMRSGHFGIFERLPGEYIRGRAGRTKHSERIGKQGDKGRYPEFYGPSMSQMGDKQEIRDAVTQAAQETVDKRVEQEITRILNGYGKK